jgi:phosphoglycerate kinase
MTIYLIRINLDIKNKPFKDALRFKVACEIIKSLSRGTNKIVLLSHRGNPKDKEKDLSLKPFAVALSKEVGKKINFIPHFKFDDIRKQINNAKGGSVFLLENLRYLNGEKENGRELSKQLASLGDKYINNDFATSHRKNASLFGITNFIPSSIGQVIKNEIYALSSATKKIKHPAVLIIGGAKAKDKISTIDHLLPKVDHVLLGGRPANIFLKLRGADIGSSAYEKDLIKKIKNLATKIKIITPYDWVTEKNAIFDIGPKTLEDYCQIIKDARTIIWNGPMGMFEKKRFSNGTSTIARAVLNNKRANIIIGGVETVSSLPIRPTKQKMSHIFISTGGGAMLHFLAGEKLPAIEALKNKL